MGVSCFAITQEGHVGCSLVLVIDLRGRVNPARLNSELTVARESCGLVCVLRTEGATGSVVVVMNLLPIRNKIIQFVGFIYAQKKELCRPRGEESTDEDELSLLADTELELIIFQV